MAKDKTETVQLNEQERDFLAELCGRHLKELWKIRVKMVTENDKKVIDEIATKTSTIAAKLKQE